MALTVEEFNREVLNYHDFNYEPVVKYLINNPYCDKFYNICKKTMEIFKLRDSKVYSKRRRNKEYESYEQYKDRKNTEFELVKDEEKLLNELAKEIMDFRKRFRYFHFEKFFLMLMCNYRLLLDDEEDINKFYFRYDQQFKIDLLKRLDFYIASKDSNVSNYMHMRFMKLHPKKQMLMKSLNKIQDDLLFQLNSHISVVIGWIKKDKNYKYAKICRDNNIIDEYEKIVLDKSKYDKTKDRMKEIENNRKRYLNFTRILSDYMNDEEDENIELIEFVERLSNEQVTAIFKQLDNYRKLYNELS